MIAQLNNTELVNIDALLLEGKVTTVTLDSIIIEQLSFTANMDSLLVKTNTSATYLDAVILAALVTTKPHWMFNVRQERESFRVETAKPSFNAGARESFRYI